MRSIYLSDITMQREGGLSFREKLELCKLLDRLGVDGIETGPIENRRVDGLLLKSLSSAVRSACLTVPVPIEDDGPAFAAGCIQEAKRARLQVALPVSTVQMEYTCHKKPEAMLELIRQTVTRCRQLRRTVEFRAEDASRAEPEFLHAAIRAACESGAGIVTVCDSAGQLLPEELGSWIAQLRSALPADVRLGVLISNALYMANSCAVAALQAGADELKVLSCGDTTVSLEKLAAALRARGESLGLDCRLRATELSRTSRQIEWLCKTNRGKASPFDLGVREQTEEFSLTSRDDRAALQKAAEKLGYDLSEEDLTKVYDAFQSVAGRKAGISARELDALIASAALQVPPAYVLESYVINAGNRMGATSHIRLLRNGAVQEGICIGDGPIDAAFLAIEGITGTHYELDDFQIRAVTEGREAMGETIVRLRSAGKLYSGRGISTDIVGSSIHAYLAALNKIVYEEENGQ